MTNLFVFNLGANISIYFNSSKKKQQFYTTKKGFFVKTIFL